MHKILILVSFFFITMIYSKAQVHEYDHQKIWQLKGFAKHANRIDDTYTSISIYSYLVKKKPHVLMYKWELGFQAQKARDYSLSYKVFDELIKVDKKNKAKATYYKAISAMCIQKYDEAIELLESISSRQTKSFMKDSRMMIDNRLEGSYLALSYKDTLSTLYIKRLEESINHAHMEFSPILLNDSNLVFTTTEVNQLEYYSDVEDFPKRKFLQASYLNDKWRNIGKAGKPFDFFEGKDIGAGAFSLDNKRFYFTVSTQNWKNELVSALYVSEKVDDKWREPQKLGNGINLQMYSSSEPTVGTCYDPKLEVIYFVSDRPGGHGGTDIWFTIYDKYKKKYQKPVNAGIFLNTSGNEATPFYDVYNHRLYFSSNGHVTIGGLDVMHTDGEMVSWDEVINMGVPINSSCDDLYYSKNEIGNIGFITSNRIGGAHLTHATCCDDIFVWNATTSDKVWVQGTLMEEQYQMNSLLQGEKKLNLAKGDSLTLDNAKIKVFIKKGENRSDFVKDYKTDSKGQFKILLNKGLNYELMIDDKRVLNKIINITKLDKTVQDLKVEMDPISVETVSEQPIILENIYYEFNDSKLKNESKIILNNTLLKLMKEYPELLIEIRSHTDNKGSAKFNLRLSEQRSNSVVDYLKTQGIDSNRLMSAGFGETMPMAENTFKDGRDNPDGRAANRRTEFRLLDTEEMNK